MMTLAESEKTPERSPESAQLDEARAQLRMAATMHPAPAYQEALGEINAHIATREF